MPGVLDGYIRQDIYGGQTHEEKNDFTAAAFDADLKQLLLHG